MKTIFVIIFIWGFILFAYSIITTQSLMQIALSGLILSVSLIHFFFISFRD